MPGFDKKSSKKQNQSQSVAQTLSLAIRHHQEGQLKEAVRLYQQVLQLEPESVEATYNLAWNLKQQGRLDEAVRYYRQAIKLQPDLAIAYNNLGNILKEQEKWEESVDCYRQALNIQPDYVEVYNNLGNVLTEQGKLSEAVQSYRQAIKNAPNFATAYNGLGIALKEQSNFEEAVAAYQQALKLKPDNEEVFNNLGVLYQEQGEFARAVDCYRQALKFNPNFLKAHSNLLFTLSANASLEPEVILREAKVWYVQQITSRGLTTFSHRNVGNPERKLRIGYVSPDFRQHSVSYFIEPVIKHHDRSQVEVYCYAQVSQADQFTKRIRAAADHWRSTIGKSDTEVAQLIQQDKIDILIDLAGHTKGNRLLAFALKPAPIQATYLGYFATTGLPAIDYWITDCSLHPEDTREKAVESIWRLNRCYVSYQPPGEAPEVVFPPCLSNGTITFGSFNNLHKITEKTVALWSRILEAVPNSRLLLKTALLDNIQIKQRLQQQFIAQRIAPERLLLRGKTTSTQEHLATYGEVDICLDTTPYTGCTTTCEALWMGVPVLTLAGMKKVERMSASILMAIGKQEWIANSATEFVDKAVDLANNPEQLKQWRLQQREQLEHSPLRDAEGLSRALEIAYRQMWRNYLELETPNSELRTPNSGNQDAIFATYNRGVLLKQQGKLGEAAQCYRQLLQLKPDFVEAHNNLGNILKEQGKLTEAVECYGQVLQFKPNFVEARFNLGLLLKEQGKLAEAAQAFRQAIQGKPSLGVAYENLATVLQELGQLDEAAQCFRQLLQIQPDQVETYNNLGALLHQQGKLAEAVQCYRQAIQLQPNLMAAYRNLSMALQELGQLDEAAYSCRQLLQLQPDQVEIINLLGTILHQQGHWAEAIQCYHQVLQLKPDFAEANYNLGISLKKQGRLAEAIDFYRKALQIKPDFAEGHNNLGVALKERGELTEALKYYRKALQLKPDYVKAHSNLLFALGANAYLTPQAMLQEALGWYNQQVLSQGITPLSHHNDLNPDRTLRIGYVSPDFRSHAVSYFIKPVIKAHDRSQVEVYCYAQVPQEDEVTRQIQAAADHWRSTVGLSDNQVAQLIQQDQIDILIDLAGHTEGNRLRVFGSKPAPVQATYLGYFATTGLPTIDYWITDEVLHPGNTLEQTVEQIRRLNRCYVAYEPFAKAPPVSPPPCLNPGIITFGSFNNLRKVTLATVELWVRVLQAIPHSRILLKSTNLADPEERLRLQQQFADRGIFPERLILRSRTLDLAEHLATYGEVDICLDTTPYTGCTTTCEALWMGVPVLTLAGIRKIERMSASILTAIGRKEWIAHSSEEFVVKAVQLARNPQQLRQLREQQRERIQQSPLNDVEGLARNLETAYRSMWQHYLNEVGTKESEASYYYGLGFSLHQQGKLAQATQYYNQALQLQPELAAVHYNLGVALKAQGQLEEAARSYRQALELQPDWVEAYNNLGNILKAQGLLEEAVECYRRAIQLKPDYLEAYNNLGIALKEQGKIEEAQRAYRQVLQLKPDFAQVHRDLGLLLQQQEKLEEAIRAYQQALQHQPNYVEAYHNLAHALEQQGKIEEAVECYRQVLQLNPDSAGTYNNLGAIFQKQNKLAEATRYYLQALKLQPDLEVTLMNLGITLKEQGKVAEAIAYYRRVLQINPDSALAKFGICLSQLPIIYSSAEEIQFKRNIYQEHLHKLAASYQAASFSERAKAAEAVGFFQPFYLAYQGFNDRELQQVYGQMICQLMASRYPQWSQPLSLPSLAANEKIRVGFVAKMFYHHSVWKIPLKGWVENLDRQHFELFAYYTGSKKDSETDIASQSFNKFVQGPYSLEKWCAEIAGDQLHILIFPEFGMDSMTVKLGCLRLAPIQMTSWGHPDTSGMPTIDYYISSDLMETENAQENYTEKLIRLPNLSIYYVPLPAQPLQISREEIGIAEDDIMFWCCQSLFKYLPQHDDVFPRIAQQLSKSKFVFVECPGASELTEIFRQRLQETFARFGFNYQDYCQIIPRLNYSQFLGMAAVADIFLDSIGWSGCNSTLEALTQDLPIVTLSGELMRGRHTLAILKMMEVEETIAGSKEGYIEMAVRLAKDPQYRQHICRQIAENKHKLYGDFEPVMILEKLFLSLFSRKEHT